MGTPSGPAGLSSRTRVVILAAVLALQAILLWIYYNPRPKDLIGDEFGYLRTAGAIGRGESPEIEPMRATLYPQLLSALGVDAQRRLPVQAAQMVMLVVAALLLRSLGHHLFDTPRSGDLAAAGMLIYPTLGAFAHYLWPDILHLTLWIAVLWVLASGRRAPGWLLLAGSLMAVAMLSRHLLLAFLPVVAAMLWLDSDADHSRRSARQRVAWFLTPVVLIVAPALWIDWSHDGRLRSASNVRFNVWVGLNEASRKSFEQPIVYREYKAYLSSAETPAERNEILERKTRSLIETQGLLPVLGRQIGRQYFRLFDKDTFFTEQLPGGALHGRRRGYRLPPGPGASTLRWLNYGLYALILAAAAWGIASCRPRGAKWLQLVLLFLAYNLAIFLVLHVKSRYRLQLMPFLILFGAYGLDRLLAEGVALGPGRRWAAIVGMTLALFLAFGGAIP